MTLMATVFTKIIEGEIPGTFVWRDDVCVAFLSINPLTEGHTLVVPIEEYDHWLDAPQHTRDHLFRVSHTISQAQHAAFDCRRVSLMIAGFEVPHLHIHLVPTNSEAELSFANAASSVERTALETAANAITQQLDV